jgi:hypothetical protein
VFVSFFFSGFWMSVFDALLLQRDDDHEPNTNNSTRFHSHARGTLLQLFLNLTLIIEYITTM